MGQPADAEATEGGRHGDVALELGLEAGVSVALELHALLEELLADVLGGGARDLDPRFREERARDQHEADVEHRVEGVAEGVRELSGRRDVVREAADGDRLSSRLELLPVAEQIDEEVASELLGEHLGHEEEVRDEGRLEDDRDVGGVEELDLVSGGLLTSDTLVLDVNVHLEALQNKKEKILPGKR